MNKKNTILLIVVTFLTALFVSCGKDHHKINDPSKNPEKAVEINLKLNTPGGFVPKTRGLTGAQESDINSIYVLAFKSGALSYIKAADVITNTASVKSFKATLKASANVSDTYKLVVLANAETEVLAHAGSDLKGLNGRTYDQVQGLMKKENLSGALYPSGGAIPMWGELPYQEISSTNKDFSVSLIRSTSRLDVGVGATGFNAVTGLADWGGLPDFTLEEVLIYKVNDGISYIPVSGNFNTTTLVATMPSIVGVQRSGAIHYSVTDGKSLVKEVYLPEADVKLGAAGTSGDANHKNRIAVVVKGSYKGNSSSYYRLDFINRDKKLVDVLRNHLYQFNIKSVSGNGFGNPDDAYNSLAVNMNVEILVWNDGAIGNILFDGQYHLGISQGVFTLPSSPKTDLDVDNNVVITTDVPAGWSVDKIVDADGDPVNWITLSESSGTANTSTTVSINTAENTTGDSRTAFIHIKAGRLSYAIEVNQTIYVEVKLLVTNAAQNEVNHYIFLAHTGGIVPPQTMTVSWLPTNAKPYVSLLPTPHGPKFNFGTGSEIVPGPISDFTGKVTYNLQPPAMTAQELQADPFLEKMTRVDIVLDHGKYISKTVFLQQINYNAVPSTKSTYQINGVEQSFTIRANAPWKIVDINDPDNILAQFTTLSGGSAKDKTPENVYFTPINNPTHAPGTVTFKIRSANANFPFADIPVTLNFFAKFASFELLCGTAKVNGIYKTQVALDATNTISINVNVTDLGTYSIASKTVEGISFGAMGSFTVLGPQTVTLLGTGAPIGARTKNMLLETNSNGAVGLTCNVPVAIVIPKKRILSLGTNGWAIHSTLGIGTMFNSRSNFGPDVTSTFKTEVPEFVNTNYIVTINVNELRNLLEPASGNPVDIVVITHDGNLSGVDASSMLARYIKKGGVVVMLNEKLSDYSNQNLNLIRFLYDNHDILAKDNSVLGGALLQLPNNNDQILNGPFGDVRGKYIGEDSGNGDAISAFPPGVGQLDWFVSSYDYSATGGNLNYLFAFKTKHYNFFWCGDSGMATGTTTVSGSTSRPALLSAAPNYRPIVNVGYGRGTKGDAYNSIFFANIMAWALQEAEFSGINSDPQP